MRVLFPPVLALAALETSPPAIHVLCLGDGYTCVNDRTEPVRALVVSGSRNITVESVVM